MELVFKFPRRNTELNLTEVNKFLSEKASLSASRSRAFGVYLKSFADVSKENPEKVKNAPKHYQLKFKFFDLDGKEVKSLTFKINQGYFDLQSEKDLKTYERIKRNVCLLSFVAALDLQNVDFSATNDTLCISVELDDSFEEHVNRHKDLFFQTNLK